MKAQKKTAVRLNSLADDELMKIREFMKTTNGELEYAIAQRVIRKVVVNKRQRWFLRQ